MDIMNLWKPISDAFLKGVHTETFKDRDNGGPECAKYMTFEYRLFTSVIMVINISNNKFLDICIFCNL